MGHCLHVLPAHASLRAMPRAGDFSSSDDDDLSIDKSARKRPLSKQRHHGKASRSSPTQCANGKSVDDDSTTFDSSTASDDTSANESRRRKRVKSAQGERVGFSDADSDEAYVTFKRRKSVQRKKLAASTRRAKAAEKDDHHYKRRSPARSSGVKRSLRKEKTWGEDSEDGDLMEHTLPEYLQPRRSRFDRRTEKLREAGLRLPPNYDEIEFSDDERMRHLKERPSFPGGQKPSREYQDIPLPKSMGLIPAPIARWLRSYQVEGAAFLHKLFVYQSGGILGDDMGLGKTVQVIAFLAAAFGKTGDERDAKRMRKMRRIGATWYPRILVICPGTLLENWRAELNRWGWWHVDTFHGDAEAKEKSIKAAVSGRLEIMLTTYTTYRMNKGIINMVEWDCVIADECHQIKGRHSETTKAINEVNALCRIGLTGTAIQNSYDELWTLLNWTNPGRFGPITTWKSTISEPLRAGQSHDATVYQLSKARKTAKALVQNLLPSFFLRRLKDMIKDELPSKSDRVVFCPLTDVQSDAYENAVDSEIVTAIKESTNPCACGSGKNQGWCCNMFVADGSKWQTHVFPAIANLQKLSNHLAMLIPQSQDPKEKQDKDLDMLEVAVPDQWRELYRNRDSILNYSNPEFCGKWRVLKKLLRFWHSNGDKVLVFSHSVRLLKMLQSLFTHTSYNVSYLDGSMKLEDRVHAVDNFNSDPGQFVFLISTKAGGVGLNITSANKVVIVDPNWNPSYDLQAQDRAYRIGQVRDVEVFRLISAGTIEEIVYARQIYKQQQANIAYTASTERRYFKGVQESKGKRGEIFGLANLLAFQGETMVLRDIVNKTNVAESRAGVLIAGLELEEGSSQTRPVDENEALSQVVDEIIEGGRGNKREHQNVENAQEGSSGKKMKPGRDPIMAILAGAGVEYTHENSEVIGSSTVEAGLSRRALEAGNHLDVGDQKIFEETPRPQVQLRPQVQQVHPDGDGDDQNVLENNDDDDDHVENPVVAAQNVGWKYHPPLDVRQRQFCSMAKEMGYTSAVELALVVEGWTQVQRRSCLERFYKRRRTILGLGGHRQDTVNGEAQVPGEAGHEVWSL